MDPLTRVTHVLLQFQVSLKIYHWQTSVFSRHDATNNLYGTMSDLIDKFVETFQGGRGGKRIKFMDDCSVSLSNFGDNDGKKLLIDFKTWLENELPNLLQKTDYDLFSLRDEMLGEVKKALYLFAMK